jgi:hypothetical protein
MQLSVTRISSAHAALLRTPNRYDTHALHPDPLTLWPGLFIFFVYTFNISFALVGIAGAGAVMITILL